MTSKRRQRRTALQNILSVALKVAEENQCLREALQVYANSAHWEVVPGLGRYSLTGPGAGEPTQVARRALGFRATYVARPPSRCRGFWGGVWRFLKPGRVTRPFPG